jgi:hypothetical protein
MAARLRWHGVQIGIRWPPEIVERIGRILERERELDPVVVWTMSLVLRRALVRGLELYETTRDVPRDPRANGGIPLTFQITPELDERITRALNRVRRSSWFRNLTRTAFIRGLVASGLPKRIRRRSGPRKKRE